MIWERTSPRPVDFITLFWFESLVRPLSATNPEDDIFVVAVVSVFAFLCLGVMATDIIHLPRGKNHILRTRLFLVKSTEPVIFHMLQA